MKKLIRAIVNYKDSKSLDIDLSEMLKDRYGRKLFGNIMNIPNIPNDQVKSYLQGCVDTCTLTNTDIPGLSEIYNAVLEHGVSDTIKTLRNL